LVTLAAAVAVALGLPVESGRPKEVKSVMLKAGKPTPNCPYWICRA
jgi:hypothetical protein